MKNTIYLSIVLLLVACQTEKSNLIITFENASGLEVGNPVLLNDYQIGEVARISLTNDYKINAEIQLNDTIRLPKKSIFALGSKDLFTKAIFVTPGKSKLYLTNKDIILGQLVQGLEMDTIIDAIQNEINNTKPVKNQDSIISELHKLNIQLEGIKKK